MEIFDRSLFSFREKNQKRKTSFLQVNIFSDLQRGFFGRRKSCILQLRVVYIAAALEVSVPQHRVRLLAMKAWLEEMDQSLALVGVKIWNASF